MYLLVDFDDALAFIYGHRNVEPAVYNHRRLKELPIPPLDRQTNNSHETSASSEDELENDGFDTTGNNESFVDVPNATNEKSNADSDIAAALNEVSIDDTPLDSNNLVSDPLAVKAESVPVYDIHQSNDAEIEYLLDEEEDINIDDDDDELSMHIGKGGMPKPLWSTSDEVIKRENDKMSGDLPFSASVRLLNTMRS